MQQDRDETYKSRPCRFVFSLNVHRFIIFFPDSLFTHHSSKAIHHPTLTMTDDKIITEILLNIGEFLDKPTLNSCLQVCSQWKEALYPSSWVTINKHQWCHSVFPIQQSTKLFAPLNTEDEVTNATKIRYCLQKVRSFEWSDNQAERRPLNWRNTVRALLADIPVPSLQVLQLMIPQLTHLSLITAKKNNSVNDLLPLLTPSNFPKIQSLVLDFPSISEGRVDIRRLYPLQSKLEELDIRGAWYHDPAQPTAEKWKLKNLTLDWIDSPFLKNCVALESLSFPQMLKVGNGSDYGISPFLTTMLKELQTMPNLNSIIFEGVGNAVDDIFEKQGPVKPGSTAAKVWENTVGEWEGQQFTLWEIICFLEV